MGLRSWVAEKIAPKQERAFVPPEQLVPPFSDVFGPNLSNQPDHVSLLAANTGVADMATRAIANRIASLELEVYEVERVDDGTTRDVVLDDHPAQILLNNPNPTLTIAQMLRLTSQFVATVGEAYWLKVRNNLGRSAQLDVLPAQRVLPLVERNVVTAYRFLDGNGEWRVLDADAVIRFWFPDPESIFQAEGYLGPNAVATDAMRYQEEHLRHHFQHNATPTSVVQAKDSDSKVPQQPELERWKQEWLRRYHNRTGSQTGVPAWLPSGWEIIFSAASSGKDLTPLLEYFLNNQLMNFGVPKSVLGMVVSGDRSSAETNQWVFDTHTINPITTMIADSLTQQLASEFDPALKIRFREFIARNTEEERAQEAHLLGTKQTTINEMRVRVRGEDPVPWGDLPVGQIAETPYTGDVAESFGEPAADPDVEEQPEPEAMDESDEDPDAPRQRRRQTRDERRQHYWARALLYEELFDQRYMRAMRRIFRQQERKTLRRYSAYAKGDDGERGLKRVKGEDLFNPQEWQTLFETALEPVLRDIYQRTGNEALANVSTQAQAGTVPQSFIFNDQVVANIAGGIEEVATRTGNTTLTQLIPAIEAGVENGESVDQIAKRIRGVFATATQSRSRTIARTETLRATQQAQRDGWDQSGVVTHKEWNTSLDGDVRDTHIPLEGVVLEMNQDFSVGGEPATGPGDPRLSAGNVINCRCFLSPVFDDEVIE